MTFVPARLGDPRLLAGAGILLLAACVGALAGYDPKLAIAAALGLAFVLLALGDLAIGVACFAFLTFVELAPLGGPAVSFAKVAGLTLAISWLAVIAAEGSLDRLLPHRHPMMTAALGLFLAWAALSLLWAEDSAQALTSVGRYALNIAVIPIAFTAIREPRHLRWVAIGLIAGAVVAAGYGLLVVPGADGAGSTPAADLNRTRGTIGDPNELASVLVVGLVMSVTMALGAARSTIGRGVCIAAALLCLTAIFTTVSRGGIVALATAIIAAVALAGPRRGRMMLAASLLVVAAAGYFAFFASQSQTDRLTNADGGSGRTDIWKVGWRMVEDKPLTGVGAGNFEISSIHYLLVEPGAIERDEYIVDQPAVAHNLYLEILADLGIPGLVLMLTVILISLLAAIRAARVFDRFGDDGSALLARAVAVGLLSILAADVFLSAEFGKLLWLLLGLGPAILAMAAVNGSERG